MKLAWEIEENGSLSFLDISITCESNNFVTSVYYKPTFSSSFTNFKSFLPDVHKCALFHRLFRLCSSDKKFHWEIETLKSIFKPSNYLSNYLLSLLPYFSCLSFVVASVLFIQLLLVKI